MTKKQTKIARKVFELMGEYVIATLEAGTREDGFIWIRDDVTGEVVIFARSVDEAQKHVPFMKSNAGGELRRDSDVS